ncbi:MAG: PA14 domain-containing protein [Chloroflexia bacterium]
MSEEQQGRDPVAVPASESNPDEVVTTNGPTSTNGPVFTNVPTVAGTPPAAGGGHERAPQAGGLPVRSVGGAGALRSLPPAPQPASALNTADAGPAAVPASASSPISTNVSVAATAATMTNGGSPAGVGAPWSLPSGAQLTSPSKAPPWLRAIIASRWVLAIPAVALALLAEQMIRQAHSAAQRQPFPPDLAWQLFAAAGLLLALAAGAIRLVPAGPSQFLGNLRALGPKTRLLFLGLLSGAVACALFSIPLFSALNGANDPNTVTGNWPVNSGSWLLYLVSLGLFAAAFVVWERSTRQAYSAIEAPGPRERLQRYPEWAIMAILFAIALFLRLRDINSIPPGFSFDEAQNGVVATQLVAPGAFHPTFVANLTQMGSIYFYVLGLVLKVLGDTFGAVRFLPALSGALLVPLVYMLGSRLYGWRAGLAAAGFLAVSAWNITFSRFGIASLPTVAVVVGLYVCMVQALRTGRLGYYAGAGVLLGIGLHMYYVGRLAPFVLLAVLLHRLIFERMRVIRSIRAGLVVVALGAVLAVLPVGLFALQRPDLYSGRTNDVSIFKPENNGGDLATAIQLNIRTHLLMFDWEGDGNGRHNLTHTPMLDWITAALFFGGLASCAFRAWRWQYFFPLVWFVSALAGGVLTLPGEAPQSHRTLENSVVTALFAGIFLGEAWQALAGAAMARRLARLFTRGGAPVPARRATRFWLGATAVSILGILVFVWLAGAMNLDKYFVQQAQNTTTWSEMGTDSAHAAELTARYGADHDIYVAAVYKDFPPSVFLAPNVQTLPWPGMYTVPFTSASKPAGAVIILDPPSAADISLLARIYPHATFDLTVPPQGSDPLLYAAIIPAADIQQTHGVLATLGDGGAPAVTSDFSYDWSRAGSSSGKLKLESTLRADAYGSYLFTWKNDSGAVSSGDLLIDGFTVAPNQPITLSTGLHTLSVTADAGGQSGTSRLMWTPPGSGEAPVPANYLFDPRLVSPHGLTAAFRPGDDFTAPPAVERIDSTVSFYFQQTPLPRPYTAEWSGRIYIPEDGAYRFGTQQRTSSELAIDGQTVLTNGNADFYQEQVLPLSAGWHDIRMRYKDMENYSSVYLYWAPPGRGKSIIPSAFLWPVMAKYPDKPEGINLPTLDQSNGATLPPDRTTYNPPRP